MRNAKKTLSLVMVAIFTTFIVLSGIPAAAVTTAQAKAQVTKATAAVVKVETTVKVATFNPTTATTQVTAATKEVAKVKSLGKTYTATYTKLVARYQAVNKKITARKAVIAAALKAANELKALNADAEAAVEAAEKATDADAADLVNDETALGNAQGAVTAALEAIVKLDQNSANYKGLMARIDAVNNVVMKAMEEKAAIDAAKAAEEAAKKLAEEAAKALEAAIAAADKAVTAAEVAPLTTDAEITAAVELGKTAQAAIAAIKNPEKEAPLTARLTAALAKGIAAVDAKKPATIEKVEAVDGTLTVTFKKAPLTTPAAADFAVTKAINGAAAVAVTPTAVATTGSVATLTVGKVAPITTEQSVVYSVVYNATGAAVSATPVVIAKLPAVEFTLSATNLKEIYVTFNQPVDKTTAETTTNYTLSAGTVSAATLTGNIVTLTLTAAAANQASVDVTVKNVKDANANVMTTTTKSVVLLDVTLPTLDSYTFTGPQTIEVTASEPIAVAGTVLIDNGIYGATTSASGNKITVTLGTVLPEGTHTMKFTGYADNVYTGIDKSFTITYKKDVTVPTVSVKSATQTKVTLTFSKPVKGDALATTYFYHTFTSYAPAAVTDADGVAINTSNYYSTVVLDFSNRPLPSGVVNVVVLKTVGTVTITDGYGNTLATDTTLPVTIVADATAPTITKVEATNESSLAITYSEDVTGAATKANYVVKKADGTVVDAATYSVAYNSTTFVATITLTTALTGGAYTVTVSNVKDTSLSANALATTSAIAFTVSDKTPIASATAIAVENTSTTADIIYVTFPEKMTTSGTYSVLDLGNYKIGTSAATATALPDGTTIALFGSNDKVKVTIPGTGGADLTGKHLYARNLADAVGNVMAVLYVDINPAADVAPVVTAIKTTALNTIVLTVDKQLSSLNAADIKVDMNGDTTKTVAAQATYVNNSDGTATITVVSASTDVLANEGALPTTVEITAAGTCKSITGTAMAVAANLVGGITPTDGIAPAFAASNVATTYDTNNNGKLDTFVVSYTEDLNKNTVSFLTYTVEGYTVTAVHVSNSADAATAATGAGNDNNGKFVVITVTPLTTNDTGATPAVTQAYAVKDVAGNTLAAQAAKTAVDTAVPVMVSAKTLSANTIEITYSENVTNNTLAPTQYVFDIDGGGATVADVTSSVAVSGNKVVLTLTTGGLTTTTAYAPATIVYTQSGTAANRTFDAAATPNAAKTPQTLTSVASGF